MWDARYNLFATHRRFVAWGATHFRKIPLPYRFMANSVELYDQIYLKQAYYRKHTLDAELLAASSLFTAISSSGTG